MRERNMLTLGQEMCEAARMRALASHAVLVAVASVTPDEPYDQAIGDATEQCLLGGNSAKIPPRLLGPITRAVLDLKPGYLCIVTDDPRLK